MLIVLFVTSAFLYVLKVLGWLSASWWVVLGPAALAWVSVVLVGFAALAINPREG